MKHLWENTAAGPLKQTVQPGLPNKQRAAAQLKNLCTCIHHSYVNQSYLDNVSANNEVVSLTMTRYTSLWTTQTEIHSLFYPQSNHLLHHHSTFSTLFI